MAQCTYDCAREKVHAAGEVVLTLAKAKRLRGKVCEGELADFLGGDGNE
jgi:hypothetical protein